ncbi:MAG: ABC transporter ATP-binding protein/permease [Dehalococcoidia bacterium]|nr:ABC transporter ATP-binding protein/permease [Dehalococcoidia bacterium]
MYTILRIAGFLRPHMRLLIGGLATMVGAIVLQMGSPLLVQRAIDFGLNPIRDSSDQITGLAGSEQTLIIAAGAILAFAVGSGLSRFGLTYASESLGQKVAYDLRNKLYGNVQRLSYAYHDTVQTGQIMSRATEDVEAVRMFVSFASLRLLMIAGMLGFGIGGMFYFDWRLALISLATMPIIVWRSVRISTIMRPLWLLIQRSQARLAEIADEGLGGIRVVKAFSREPLEAEKFSKASGVTRDLQLNQAITMAKHAPLMQGIFIAQMGVTVSIGALFISQGSINAGVVTAFLLWLTMLQMPVRMLGFMITMFSRAVAAGERVFEVLDTQSAVQEKEDALDLVDARGHVRFENVSFSYSSASPVLSDIDIDATPGKIIALLGPTGSGKSTVVSLLPRFYDVTSGRITIDGEDIREFKLDSLRTNIGTVQQDVFLFVGTLRDNIAYGRPGASQEDVEAAAKAARIHDFITSLPYGYDEWVGERGVTLSGGQKQRIAIARTILLNPRILVFDDSTASVDTQTEFLIQQALNVLMESRTTFVIAQRLRTVLRADEILVLDEGKIVERGKHEELLTNNGLYRDIYDLELREQEEALGESLAAPGGGN